jgi:hypothetical protein
MNGYRDVLSMKGDVGIDRNQRAELTDCAAAARGDRDWMQRGRYPCGESGESAILGGCCSMVEQFLSARLWESRSAPDDLGIEGFTVGGLK